MKSVAIDNTKNAIINYEAVGNKTRFAPGDVERYQCVVQRGKRKNNFKNNTLNIKRGVLR